MAMLRGAEAEDSGDVRDDTVQKLAGREYRKFAEGIKPPQELRDRFQQAVQEEQIRDLERL